MIDQRSPINPQSDRLRGVLGVGLLILALILLVARTQITEALPGHWSGASRLVDIGFAEVTTTVIFAAAILSGAVLYLLALARSRRPIWRPTGLVLPLVLCLVAAVLAVSAASNKNTAIIGALTFISLIVLAILLVQWLDRPAYQRLLLAAIAAAGVTQAYRCYEQYSSEIPFTRQMFEEDPNELLRNQGFEPGSYQAQQFAARITSGDINGYFASSNTAAAFFILSLAATLALLAQSQSLAAGSRRWIDLVLISLAALAQLAGLLLTASKGGIAAGLVMLLLIPLLWFARHLLVRHWRLALVVAGLAAVAIASLIVVYGLGHDRLPSASLWVRWQYWRAAAAMIADHPLTGVGPENFGQYYPRYMNPAAPEVVKDPHCFPLALWSQWGILAMFALVWAVVAVAIRLARPVAACLATEPNLNRTPETNLHQQQIDSKSPDPLTAWQLIAVVIVLAVTLIRFAVSDLSQLSPLEKTSILLTSYVMPAFCWVVAFALLFYAGRPKTVLLTTTPQHRGPDPTLIVLAAGLLGFLLHSLIDYAIFQPGVGGIFFALLGLALAIKNQHLVPQPKPRRHYPFWIAALLGLAVTVAVWARIVVPVARAQHLTTKAQALADQTRDPLAAPYAEGLLRQAASLADQAGRVNSLDPDPAQFQAELLLNLSQEQTPNNTQTFLEALGALQLAVTRNPASHLPYRQLAETYAGAARRCPDNAEYQKQSIHYSHEALRRYPVSSELLVKHALLLLDFGPDLGLDDYRVPARESLEKALEYEQAFRRQQAQMFTPSQRLPRRLDPQLESQARSELKDLAR